MKPRLDPGVLALLSAAHPAIDLRAPVEYAQGALPHTINLPILSDEERAQVGTTYKREGAEAARALGHELVSGTVRAQRLEGWCEHLKAYPDAPLFCWRGGERSQTAAAWIRAEGLSPQLVPGGYKALRRSALALLEAPAAMTGNWWVLAGRTGSGKTELLQHLDAAIDLERLARHRGSAFGAQAQPQPAPATFENAVACALLSRSGGAVVVEDEGRIIGRLGLPAEVHALMQRVPLALLEIPLETRTDNIRREYVDEALATQPPEALHERYQAALDRIQRRLGGDRHKTVSQALASAFQNNSHEEWIALLLRWYYDPMYDYQLSKKIERVDCRGDAETVLSYLRARTDQ